MTDSMTLLVIVDGFWPERTGGISKSLLTEVEGLVEAGHEVIVVTRTLDQNAPEYESRDGYDLYRYRAPPTESRWYHFYPLYSIGRLPGLVDRLHERLGFDLAYVHNPVQSIGLERADSSIPEVYTYHAPMAGEIAIEAEQGKYGWKTPAVKTAARVFERIEYHVVNSADTLLARSQFMYDEMERIHGPRYDAEIRPLAVDTERFAFENDPCVPREDLDLPEDRPILVTFRRLKPRVGLEMLIDAMQSIVDEHPDVLLLIGGKGHLRESLEKQVRRHDLDDNVRFLGYVEEEDLPTYYAAADVSVMPTKELEGFGLSTIESLSCGTPVVATPVGANPEVLGSFEQRLVCDSVSAASLATTLNRLISLDPSSSPDARTNCRKYCTRNFSKQAVTEQLTEVFSETREIWETDGEHVTDRISEK